MAMMLGDTNTTKFFSNLYVFDQRIFRILALKYNVAKQCVAMTCTVTLSSGRNAGPMLEDDTTALYGGIVLVTKSS